MCWEGVECDNGCGRQGECSGGVRSYMLGEQDIMSGRVCVWEICGVCVESKCVGSMQIVWGK